MVQVANITGTAQAVEVSADGNYAWVGTSNGRVYRIAGLQGARSYGTADLDSGATAVSVDLVHSVIGRMLQASRLIQITMIAYW